MTGRLFCAIIEETKRKGVVTSMLERIKGMLRKITSSNGLATA
ncbi:hypothetical protein [Enterococcus phage vB_Efs19_KEN17]